MNPFEIQARRDLTQLGRKAVIVNQIDPVRDPDHGTVHYENETTTNTRADIVFRGGTNFDKHEAAVSNQSIGAIAWVHDDEDVLVRTGGESTEQSATRIRVDGLTLIVRSVFPEDNGLLRLHCEVRGHE